MPLVVTALISTGSGPLVPGGWTTRCSKPVTVPQDISLTRPVSLEDHETYLAQKSMHSFIDAFHLFDKYLLDLCYGPGTVRKVKNGSMENDIREFYKHLLVTLELGDL